ncbi:MAG: uL13 family ribosomal protein, partial [Patescibacteria group bacterium]|nr:uL13 family ribosomal protein [Patescibacteria group bacterium]
NASEVVVTGKKETDKYYYHYSGYPGGLKKTSVSELRAVHPERIILAAVSNMLPKNKLRQEWLNKLHVFAEGKHTFEDKFKKAKKVEEKK